MLTLLLISCITAIVPRGMAFPTTTISIVPHMSICELGQTFTVEIWISDVEMLNMWSVSLTFDHHILWTDTDLVKEGTFLRQWGAPTFFYSGFGYDFQHDVLYLAIDGFIETYDWVDGSGPVASITFMVVGNGETDLHLYETNLLGIGGYIPHTTEDGHFSSFVALSAVVDINPDALNLRSVGQWITAYIQLPTEYSAADINATTILLNGTISPVQDLKYGFVTDSSEYLVDHNNDGILERMVKFDRATVESFIYNQGIRYGNVALTITGKLFDGILFEGTDIIFVNYAGDANNDGTINVLDAGVINAHWGIDDSNTDFNKDGIVNILDLGILNVNWGQTVPSTTL